MEDPLKIKIDHYCAYMNLAVGNFRKANYSDAALNCRKAAEAACKVLIFHEYSARLAEKKILDKSLKELIQLIIKENISERKAINNIEALQIIGNKAAHDNIISREQGAYALNALNLLTDYLFTEKLKMPLPKVLDEDQPKERPASPENEKIIIRERVVEKHLDKEAEELLMNKVRSLGEEERRRYEELLNQKESSILAELKAMNRIHSNDAAKENIVRMEALVSEHRTKGRRRKTLIITLAAVFIVFTALTFLWIQLKEIKKDNDRVILLPFNKHPDTLYVAINKLMVMQDNPKVDYPVESILAEEIRRKSPDSGLSMKIDFTELNPLSQNNDSVVDIAERLGYDVVYYGLVFESALKDSNMLQINGALTRHRTFYRDKVIQFIQPRDSTFIKEINDQANISIYGYALTSRDRNYKQLANSLKDLTAYSSENKDAISFLYANLILMNKEYQTALTVLNSLGNLYEVNIEVQLMKAHALTQLGHIDSARHYYERAIVSDAVRPEVFINYGDLELQMLNKKKARSLYMKAFSMDSTNAIAKSRISALSGVMDKEESQAAYYASLFAGGKACNQRRDYGAACQFFSELYELQPDYPGLRIMLSTSYFNSGKKQKALQIATEAFNKDSTHGKTASLYASILYLLKPGNHKLVKHYFSYASALNPGEPNLHETYARFLFKNKEYDACVKICEMVKVRHPDNLAITQLLGSASLNLKKHDRAIRSYEQVVSIAPNDTNYAMLAQCYYAANSNNGQDLVKGFSIIKKALEINPRNGFAHTVMARYQVAFNDLVSGRLHYNEARKYDRRIQDPVLEKVLTISR